MKKINLAAWMLLVSAFVFSYAGTATGQSKNKLSIGDQAPPLKYSKWIKGKPVKSFEGDHLYVLEFWATWCGPCKAAMPHLTELQKEYKGKATFIGVGVWEKVEEGKPYESSLPMLEKFVKGNDANMGYSVVADNNEQFMGNNWLKAAGENGIPSTFIIKNNQIIWIGHPGSLDSTLPGILNGTYDMAAFKASFDRKAEARRGEMATMQAALKPIQDAITNKDYKSSLSLMDKLVADSPQYKFMVDQMRFGVLLNYVNQQQAIEFAKELQKTNKSVPGIALSAVYNKNGFDKSTYLWAAKTFEEANPNLTNPVALDAVASCYAKAGDYASAIANEEKAVEGARKALKNGEMVGTIMDYTVVEYEKTLENYKKMKGI
ncbi:MULTISPECIES: TlpA disulfide reductase family protein [unclassified Chitinophaga]|uniref:TlpA disulfide reductase family protein n=1 Tax=unclassified Chitinophaga TaxID=2619133 RepID=UPI0030101174